MVQPIGNQNFDVSIKIDSPIVATDVGTSQGLMVLADDQNFITFALVTNGTNLALSVQTVTDGAAATVFEEASFNEYQNPICLRLARTGVAYIAYYSVDGVVWTQAASLTDTRVPDLDRSLCRQLQPHSCQSYSGRHGHQLVRHPVIYVRDVHESVVMWRSSVMSKKPLQVLLVEDNAGDARLLREMFSKETPGSFELSHLTHMRDAEVRLAKGGVDIVLLDMGLPDGHGLETLRRARAAAPDVVMIVMTGLEDEALAAEAMKEGAQDYLIKGQIENRALPRALRHAIERQRMQVETDLIRKHQVQLRDEFLSHVSHELRSPLTSIYSFSTIIADGLAGETSQQQDEYLQIILRNVRQLQAMIEDLLEVTQAQAGKLSVELQCVSVHEAISLRRRYASGSRYRERNHPLLRSIRGSACGLCGRDARAAGPNHSAR